MDKQIEKLLDGRKISESEAQALNRALEESMAGDDVLLRRVREGRKARRISTLGTAVSVFLVVLALVLIAYAGVSESTSYTAGQSASETIVETGPHLDILISTLEQKLRKPGTADDYNRLSSAYKKRFQESENREDLLKASHAAERALVLMKKNPKEAQMKMNTLLFTVIFVLLIIGAVGLVVMSLYNGLVKRDENVDARWAQVETVLQRRADLIPQLVETVKGYAKHESETLLQVTEARSNLTAALGKTGGRAPTDKAVINQLNQATSDLGSALGRLMMLVEQYPDLKANQSFISLQDQLEGTENRIAVERGRYNDAVRSLNTTLRSFPHNVFGGSFGFEPREYFQSKVGAEEPVEVKF